MSDAISKFQRLIDRINVIYGLIIPVGLLTLIAALQWLFTPEHFQEGSFFVWLVVIGFTASVFALHFFMLQHISRMTLRILYAFYHIALIVFSCFVAPYLSSFEVLWILLAIGVDLLFGRRWILITFSAYIFTLVYTFISTDQVFTASEILNTLIQVVGIICVTYLVSKYRQISDEERTILDSTSRVSAFERQRLLSLINNMGEAVAATDESGKILLYNAAMLELLDTNQSLENKKLDDVLNLKSQANRHIKLFDLAKKSSTGVTSTEYRHQYKPNDLINLYINLAPIKLGFKQDSDKGYIVLLRDITKEKSLEEERDEFISVVSHELRTPVAIAEGNISNALYINEKKQDIESVKSSLNEAHEQIIFLAKMINDLATLSRAERTDVSLEISEVDIATLMHTLTEDYLPQAEAKKLKLTVSVAPGIKPIQTSELYLHEILQNFITNALKYTKKGSVILHARSNSNGEAVISVADSGIGLTKSDQKRIFDKFFRSEDYRTRESSGTGLGLYVTAKLANRINAKVELESELNKGSTFTITVPSIADHHA